MTSLQDLQNATVAHTDSGDFLQIDGELKREFILPGKITKVRAGLFFLDIDGVRFSTHKKDGFAVDEEVNCIVSFHINENKKEFVVKGLEKKNE